MGRGRFITFEGGDGAGKSTQIGRLKKRLERKGFSVLVTREPGGSPGAEEIRDLLVKGEPGRWDAMSEALLFFAARRNHVETVIKPALAKGQWVLCDRFADSTMAYQGYAGGLGKDVIATLYKTSLGNFAPDLTVVLDIAVGEGLTRSTDRNHRDQSDEDRFERMGADFHEKLRQAFLEIARHNPARCVVVDASPGADEVEGHVWTIVTEKLIDG